MNLPAPQTPVKASRLSRRIRSIFKRTLLRPINKSNAFFLQLVPDWVYSDNVDFQALRQHWSNDGSYNNEGDVARLLFLIANTQTVLASGVKGAFAELGVWRGNSAKIFQSLAPRRKLYLLDTFAGFSQKDTAVDPSAAQHTGFSDTSLGAVKAFVGAGNNVVYCPGYFPETASLIPRDETFALVHLDCDLYAPIKAGLEFFYPRLNPGGMMIIHDYRSGGHWPGVAKAVDEFMSDKPEGIITMPDKSGTAIFVRARE